MRRCRRCGTGEEEFKYVFFQGLSGKERRKEGRKVEGKEEKANLTNEDAVVKVLFSNISGLLFLGR